MSSTLTEAQRRALNGFAAGYFVYVEAQIHAKALRTLNTLAEEITVAGVIGAPDILAAVQASREAQQEAVAWSAREARLRAKEVEQARIARQVVLDMVQTINQVCGVGEEQHER